MSNDKSVAEVETKHTPTSLRRIADLLIALITPSCWLQNDPFCREWDEELSALLDAGERFTNISAYEATIGGYRVWITNHPYASFTFRKLRPRRTTILRAHRRLVRDSFSVVSGKERNRRDALAEIACNQSMRGAR